MTLVENRCRRDELMNLGGNVMWEPFPLHTSSKALNGLYGLKERNEITPREEGFNMNAKTIVGIVLLAVVVGALIVIRIIKKKKEG